MKAPIVPLAERGSTPEARVLLASLHQDRNRLDQSGIESLSPAQWDHLVTLAGQQRVRPLLHRRLFETGRWRLAPEQRWHKLDDECRGIAMRKMRMHSELARILEALDSAGIPTIVLKGAYLGPVVYKNIALREMNDLDIMVPLTQWRPAVERLTSIGYETLRSFAAESNPAVSHHVSLVKPGAAKVEVHWTITLPTLAGEIDLERLWHSARALPDQGTKARSLSPTDQLLHLCYHASFLHQFEFGLRPSCDLQHLIAFHGEELDWKEIEDEACRRSWSRGVGLTLALSNALVGTDAPDDVMGALGADDEALTIAAQLCWATPTEIRDVYTGLADLGGDTTWSTKLHVLRARIFTPPAELQAMYGVPPTARWWRLLYVRRFGYLVGTYAVMAARLLVASDESTSALARSRTQLRRWLMPS